MAGGSPDRVSLESGAKRSSVSSGGRQNASSSSSSSSGRKEFFRKLMDSEALTERLEDWYSDILETPVGRKPAFDLPFDLTELQKFDYALEAVSFQQLIRMPSALYASTSDAVEASSYLAIEDFLHASVKGLWDAFWCQEGAMPFAVASLFGTVGGSKFFPAEKAISNGKVGGLCATAVMAKNTHHSNGKWQHILQIALLRPDVGSRSMEDDRIPSLPLLGQALFFGLRILIARSLSRSSSLLNPDCVFVLLVDSQYGRVVKVEGDVNKLHLDLNGVYDCAAEWIRTHSKISVSPLDRIWNQLGNANWGDVAALNVLLATFYCIYQFTGVPKLSIEDLASEHTVRLGNRRSERQLEETQINGNGFLRFQHHSFSPEIVEVHEEHAKIEPEEIPKLEVGSVLWLEDSDLRKGFQINEILGDGHMPIYSATSVEESVKALLLYVGSRPSHIEPAWEDMSLWYQVQRQTKVLNIMKQRGVSSKYLPQLTASGRIIHPGQCRRPSSGGKCDHPWCGTPILVTYPVGASLADLIKYNKFQPHEALICFRDCLSALSTAASNGIRHGDIRPENVIHVTTGVKNPFYVLVGWGHAVLDDRDRPAMNLIFSSSYALQEGKLCSASDAESLIYLLYFLCGGVVPDLDSVEGALEWRVAIWSRRLIQQKLGEISAVLKAFADYVDSLCGTPYPVNYDIWLKRLRTISPSDDQGKGTKIDHVGSIICELTMKGDAGRHVVNV